MLKFSFLIPIYNGEKYLARLLESLLEQDMLYDDYEIICLSDCSPDNSVEIVKKFQQQYSNIKLIINEKNLRVATNINMLISLACGEFVWMIGQDDFIEPNCLGRLYAKAKKDDLDILLFNYRRVNDDETTNAECRVFKESQVLSGLE